MNIFDLTRLVRAEWETILAVFCAFLLAGTAFHFLQPEKYEVSMLVESRLSTMGPYSANLPWTVKQAVDSGLLAGEAAKKAGVPEAALPRFGATVSAPNQLVKIYAYVPRAEIQTAQKGMLALVGVLSEKFPKDNAQYFDRITALVNDVYQLDGRVLKFSPKAEAASMRAELQGIKGVVFQMRRDAAFLQSEGSLLHIFGLRVVVAPSVAQEPAGPTLPQTLISFGLLGLFAGLSAALFHRQAADAAGEDVV